MAGAAANFEYVLVGMLTDEGHQRRQDTGVVVLLVSPVVCLGDAVVVYGWSHPVSLPAEPGHGRFFQRDARRSSYGGCSGSPAVPGPQPRVGPDSVNCRRSILKAGESVSSRQLWDEVPDECAQNDNRNEDRRTAKRPIPWDRPLHPVSIGEKVVGAKGFEPSTPRSRTECSTRLSHAPTSVNGYSTSTSRHTDKSSSRASAL